MTSSTGPGLALAALCLAWPAAGAGAGQAAAPTAPPALGRIAILPTQNLAGTQAPLEDIQARLTAVLTRGGAQVISPEELAPVMARHRIRYTAGLDRAAAQALGAEAGATAVLVSVVSLYRDAEPPAVALVARLVSTGAEPAILAMQSVSLTGDQSPGLLELGVIHDPERLVARAADRLGKALWESARRTGGGGRDAAHDAGPERWQPRRMHGRPAAAPAAPRTVAVLPLVDRSQRRNAGELMALELVRELSTRRPGLTTIEPGRVREAMLDQRLLLGEGLDLDQLGKLRGALAADLVVSGTMLDYLDRPGHFDGPYVHFSLRVFDARSGTVVWTSLSRNSGREGLALFGRGRVHSAAELSSRMARAVVAELLAALEATPAQAASTIPQP